MPRRAAVSMQLINNPSLSEQSINSWIFSSARVTQRPLCFPLPGTSLPCGRCGSNPSCSPSPGRPRRGWPSGSARCGTAQDSSAPPRAGNPPPDPLSRRSPCGRACGRTRARCWPCVRRRRTTFAPASTPCRYGGRWRVLGDTDLESQNYIGWKRPSRAFLS